MRLYTEFNYAGNGYWNVNIVGAKTVATGEPCESGAIASTFDDMAPQTDATPSFATCVLLN